MIGLSFGYTDEDGEVIERLFKALDFWIETNAENKVFIYGNFDWEGSATSDFGTFQTNGRVRLHIFPMEDGDETKKKVN